MAYSLRPNCLHKSQGGNLACEQRCLWSPMKVWCFIHSFGFLLREEKSKKKKMQVHKGKGIVFKYDLSQVTKKQSWCSSLETTGENTYCKLLFTVHYYMQIHVHPFIHIFLYILTVIYTAASCLIVIIVV